MILGLIFFSCQIIFGFLIFNFFDPERKFNFIETIASAFLLGLAASSSIILLLALVFSSLAIAMAGFALIFLSALAIRRKNLLSLVSSLFIDFKNSGKKIYKKGWFVFLALVIIFYSFFLSTILFKNDSGNLESALVGWGDNALHLTMIKRFATAEPFILEHPVMSGVNLAYPFMVNFISGFLHKLGTGIILAYRLPLYAFGISAILLLFCFAKRFLKSGAWAGLALSFILLGSGLGIFVLYEDVQKIYQSDGPSGLTRLFTNPSHEYTHLDNRTGGKLEGRDDKYNIVWMAPVISFMSHQRSFPAGIAVFFFVLLGFYHYAKTKYLWRFGVIAGMLPFFHAHSFLSLFFVSAILFVFSLKFWREWIKFALTAALLALPQIIFFSADSSNVSTNIFKPWFGWMTCAHKNAGFFCDSYPEGTDSNALIFWSKNFGAVFWLWITGVIFLIFSKNKSRAPYVSASIILFLVPNFFLLQPWEFDNNKMLFYWWILAVIFCAIPLLKILWEKKLLGKILAVLIIFLGISAGSFDFASKFFWTKKIGSFGYSDSAPENMEMADWIKNNTSNNDIFLVNPWVDPVPAFLAGRPIYLGFEGWLWTQGLDYQKNKNAMTEILSGNLNKACEENIKFILLDKNLENNFPNINKKALEENAEKVFSQQLPGEEIKIYKTICQNY